jgi:filamentous hemagglutinin
VHRSNDTLTATTLNAGNSLTVVSGKDINLSGSAISLDKGTATLVATGSVNVGAASETHVDNAQETHKHGTIANSKQVASSDATTTTVSQGSLVSADAVTIASGKDINVSGSTIVGTDAVKLAAGRDVNIVASQDRLQESASYETKQSGISGSGGIGISIGSSLQKANYDGAVVSESQSRSTVGSTQGNVVISAGRDLHIGGSDIVAGAAAGDVSGETGNIVLKAQKVTIDPGQDDAQAREHQEARSAGVTVAVTGTPLDMVRNVKDGASSGTAYDRVRTVGGEIGASSADTPSITTTISRSSSSSTTDTSSSTHSGSTILGAGNVTVIATGGAETYASGRAIDGDITVTGSTIMAGGATTLDANRKWPGALDRG